MPRVSHSNCNGPFQGAALQHCGWSWLSCSSQISFVNSSATSSWYMHDHMFHSFALYGDAKLGPHEVNALSRSFVNKDDFVKRSERIPTEQLNFRPLKRRGSVYEKPAMQIVNQATPACNRTLMMLVVIRSWLTHIPSLRLLMLHGEKCTSTSFWPLPILFWARKTESSNHPKLKSFYISCRMRTD